MLSFNNDVALKQQLIDHLKQIELIEDNWSAKAIDWNGQAGSLVGNLLQSNDLNDWDKLGLPRWIALCLDYFLITAPSLKQGVEAGILLLESIPVSMDLSKVGSKFILELLQHESYGMQKITVDPVVQKALATSVEIHNQCLTDTEVSNAEWRRVRKQLLETTTQFEEDSLEQLICIFAEATAWNPDQSRTAVSDSIRTWNRAQTNAIHSPTWSNAQEQRVRELLEQLYQSAEAKQKQDGTDEFIDVFLLLEQHYPEDATKLKAQIAWQSTQPAVYWQHSVDLLEHRFSALS